MFRAISYVFVGVAAFFSGGILFQYIGNAGAVAEQAGVRRGGEGATTREFAIEGMSCQGCADTVTTALTNIPDVESAKVSLEEKRAIVAADQSRVPTEKILAAISAAGYKGRLAAPAAATTSRKQPILVNITRGKNELHAVSMALGLAQSAIEDGRKAVVFLNVEAPVFAAKDLDERLKYSDFPPVKKMLADFVAAGGQVLVCEHCAQVAKLEQQDMIDGARITSHAELFANITPETMVFSY